MKYLLDNLIKIFYAKFYWNLNAIYNSCKNRREKTLIHYLYFEIVSKI